MNGKVFLAIAAAWSATLVLTAAPRQAPGAYLWDIPKSFPTPRVPATNPMSEAKAELGRYLGGGAPG